MYYYKPHRRDDGAIRKRIREISEVRIRYGFWKVFTLLRREGWNDNHKRVYRIYKEEGLNLRTKRSRRRKAAAHRMERPDISSINQGQLPVIFYFSLILFCGGGYSRIIFLTSIILPPESSTCIK